MNKSQFLAYLKILAGPVFLCMAGLVLLVSPDTASALVGKVLGWLMVLVGAGFAVSAFSRRGSLVFPVVAALALLGMGSWLLRNPLALASGVGRLLGLLLLIQGGGDFFSSLTSGGKLLSGVTAVLGLILLLLPMTTSRLLFAVLGAVLIATGVTEALSRLRQRRLDSGDGSVIDAE